MGNHQSNPVHRKHSLPALPTEPKRNPVAKSFSMKHQLNPLDKLAKLLSQKCWKEESVNGITLNTFVRYLFPKYPDIGKKLFVYFCSSVSKSLDKNVISVDNFRQQAEKAAGVTTDEQQVLLYVKMFCECKDEIEPDQFHELLYTVYKLAMDHYPEGPQSCRYIFTTIKSVVDSAFHKKTSVSVNYLSHWICNNCPRLISLLHRYIIHVLSTSYRNIEEKSGLENKDLELTTPVLEKTPSFEVRQPLLPVSQVWILSNTLPPLYIRPTVHQTTPATSTTFLAKVLDLSCPSHWTLLYNSSQHGIGANRFIYHVMGYKGPTLAFFRGVDEDIEFCLASSQDWRESHLYWGGEECMLLQILPLYRVVEKGSKLLYFNSSIRGYPFGLRVGKDPRNPAFQIDMSFEKITFLGIPYRLMSVEVWGCGEPNTRDHQIELKEWEVKQVEKNRKVKLPASEWIDHPDRYLLELGGLQTYNGGKSQ